MKRILFLFIAALAALTLYAQNPLEFTDEGNTTREQWRDNVLRMDKNQVPTGFLLEYSMFGFESDKYDGQGTDDIINNDGRIFELHNILWHSKVNSNASIAETDTLYAAAYFANLNNDVIPIACIYQSYNRIRQTALNEGLFTIASDDIGILDVPGRPTSPYDTYELFAFAPFKTSITRFNAIPFTLPAELFYVQGIGSIQIDFGDGAGFRNLTPGSSVNIYYAESGTKNIIARLNTPNGLRQAQCAIEYIRPPAYYAPNYSWHIETDPVYTDDNQYLGSTAARILDGPVIPCEGSFQERLLCGLKPNANIQVITGCDNVLDRPIIFVEGFDPDGDIDFEEMIRRLGFNNFIETMRGYGHDLVLVDFTNTNTYIENNAKVLEAVINKVNQEKTGSFQSTVIGFSMGGLIARWCIRDMEERGLSHQVENYFSYDAPHQGANIPLGMQYIFREVVRDLPYLKLSSSLRALDEAFQSHAARQMLVTYGSYNNSMFNWVPNLYTLDPLRAAFAQRLQAKGYPQQTRNFGIAFGRGNNPPGTKGAGIGQQFTPGNPFNPQDNIFSGGMGFLLVNAEAVANAVPENNTKATIAYYSFFGLTWRKIFGVPVIPVVTLRSRRFDYTGQFAYDDAQGSYAQTQTEFVWSWAGGFAGPATTNSHDGHNFVATASALDLTNQGYSSATNWQSNNMFFNIDNLITSPGQVNGNRLSNPSISPFLAVMTGTSDCPFTGCNASDYRNENKTRITPPNSSLWNHDHNTEMTYQTTQFIERNILNAQPFNCAGGNGLCSANPTIAGPSNVCTSGNFMIQGLPNGVTINWRSETGRFIITQGQGTPNITIDKISDGADKIILTLTNLCGLSRTIEYGIYFGVPSVYSGAYYGSESAENGEVILTSNPRGILNLSDNNGYTSSTWTRDPASDSRFSITPLAFGVIGSFPRNAPSFTTGEVDVSVTHACGTGTGSFVFVWVGNAPAILLVSPNPANSSLNVQVNASKDEISQKTIAGKQGEKAAVSLYRVEIIDKTGNVILNRNFSTGAPGVTLDVSFLKSDVYTLRAYTGKEWILKKIIIQH